MAVMFKTPGTFVLVRLLRVRSRVLLEAVIDELMDPELKVALRLLLPSAMMSPPKLDPSKLRV